MAFYQLEPFGDDWRRSARASLTVATAFGAKADAEFEEKFLPTYNPHRVMTEDEIMAEFERIKLARRMAD